MDLRLADCVIAMRIVKENAPRFQVDPVAMEANVHVQALHPCEANGQVLELLPRKATQRPYILGNFPSAHIDLRCKPR